MLRLNKYIAQTGLCSRRKADELISTGKVKVNGKINKKLGISIDPTVDEVSILTTSPKANQFHWKPIKLQSKIVTYAMYKPFGYVTSMKKQSKDPVIVGLVPNKPRVFPIGRLDKESEGLLLLTNDGELAQRLSHPSSHMPKTYYVEVITPNNFDENNLKSKLGRLRKGVRIDGVKTQPADIRLLEFIQPHFAHLQITLNEGKNRQIRKMMGMIQCEVKQLKRISIGPLRLEDLGLSKGEIAEINPNVYFPSSNEEKES